MKSQFRKLSIDTSISDTALLGDRKKYITKETLKVKLLSKSNQRYFFNFTMEDGIENEKSIVDKNNAKQDDDDAQYIECIRLVEGGHLRRFENLVKYFDVVQYESDDKATKPLIFYAIERNNDPFVKFLLQMEIPLNKSYTNSSSSMNRSDIDVFVYASRS
ncbi:unnamed protein product [Adineta ricciae]|uniref:Uncharacterized protein n=1 Tax=Adineta ricciae TaxID=249248 RepID=A0A813W7S7_ADIRI|nr:unnamed protein product [Adineta ricciae]CAF1617773.1 unnamed protein product [Adineta ricciae]